MSTNTLWYKDAIIYEIHVKAFRDSDGDGYGDFRGLIQRLDYLERLGVNTIWLLPFYPSPLRDDGYDISNYRSVHEAYGTIRNFRRFVREAHRRNLRVLTELVINHTSDQHPWFQRARRAAKGSLERDFYVWSDDPDRYADARIVFSDTEESNWTWDPVAKSYYWHRFYHHQPDLNFANPRVLEEIFRIMRFWLDAGVDGMRLDAVTYLCERDGTLCESLPETHEVLKRLRKELDESYSDRIFLAEVNQWPDQIRPYFGDGDECHMAFHFPLMPRLFQALRQEDRTPIVQILEATPPLPDSCQWAIFLRNHDELTLEMVTEEEKTFMYRHFARNPRMRINAGIRRRLAPLLANSRRQIELMNALLFSMPGSPVLYYGDEIGMGDNFYLGDRDGVRTPMQWTGDRNAGFSDADPAALYRPLVSDPVYGYQAVNVEAQERQPESLLNWTRQLIRLRKLYPAFARGSFEFVETGNTHILSYLRRYGEESILVVCNLSRFPQAGQLELAAFDGYVPIELFGDTPFPKIGDGPYPVTLGAHTFFWFELSRSGVSLPLELKRLERWESSTSLPLLRVRSSQEALEPGALRSLEGAALARHLVAQPWFDQDRPIPSAVRFRDLVRLRLSGTEVVNIVIEVEFGDGESDLYQVPLTFVQAETHAEAPEHALARVDTADGTGYLIDATEDPRFTFGLVQAFATETSVDGGGVRWCAESMLQEPIEVPEGLEIRVLSGGTSHTTLAYGDRWVLKLLRRVHRGTAPGLEVERCLGDESALRTVPRLAGVLRLENEEGTETICGLLYAFFANRGTAASAVRDQAIECREGPDPAFSDSFLREVGEWGREVRLLHEALASGASARRFGVDVISRSILDEWALQTREVIAECLSLLERQVEDQRLDAVSLPTAKAVLLATEALTQLPMNLAQEAASDPGLRMRTHGDLHLGELLRGEDGGFLLIDFEGDSRLPVAERQQRKSPLRDVARVRQSIWEIALEGLSQPTGLPSENFATAETFVRALRERFERGYLESAAPGEGSPVPASRACVDALLTLFELEWCFGRISADLRRGDDPGPGALLRIAQSWTTGSS